jgi:hypothetical protein
MEFGKGSWKARPNGQFGALSYRSLMPQAIRSIAYQDLFGMSWHRQVGGGGGGGGGVVVVADVITRAIVSFERSMVNSGIGIISFFSAARNLLASPCNVRILEKRGQESWDDAPRVCGRGAWRSGERCLEALHCDNYLYAEPDRAGGPNRNRLRPYQVRRAVYCRTRAPCAEFRRLMMPSLEGEGRPGWFSTLNASRLMRSLTLSVIGTVL